MNKIRIPVELGIWVDMGLVDGIPTSNLVFISEDNDIDEIDFARDMYTENLPDDLPDNYVVNIVKFIVPMDIIIPDKGDPHIANVYSEKNIELCPKCGSNKLEDVDMNWGPSSVSITLACCDCEEDWDANYSRD